MLLISFGLAAPFTFRTSEAMDFMNKHPYIIAIVSVVLLIHQVVNIAMCFEACCGGGPCMRTYLKMFVKVPWNYAFLLTYSVCIGVVVGLICAQYEAASVVFVFGISAAMMLGLTLYAVFTKTDFTGCGMYIFAMLMGLLVLGLVGIIFPSHFLYTAYAVCGAVLMSFVIIYDTQLIFGTVSMELGRSNARRIEFTIDMYAFAAYQLYLDFINLFLYLLELFGKRRN